MDDLDEEGDTDESEEAREAEESMPAGNEAETGEKPEGGELKRSSGGYRLESIDGDDVGWFRVGRFHDVKAARFNADAPAGLRRARCQAGPLFAPQSAC